MMMTPRVSPLSNFLEEILNTSDHSMVEIQNDNARLLAAGSCCTQERQRIRRRRNSNDDDYPIASFFVNDDQHRRRGGGGVRHNKGTARWETHITTCKNDFMVTAPLRRKVYCEPEKIRMQNAYYPPMRSAQIPLKDLAGSFGSSSASAPPPPPSSSSSTIVGDHHQQQLSDCKPSAEQLTSDLLDEALCLLSSD